MQYAPGDTTQFTHSPVYIKPKIYRRRYEVNKEIMDREFPIYNEYHFAARMDWNYSYATINSYLNDFKNIYSEMKDEELLVYEESW